MADRNSDYRADRRPRWNSQAGDRDDSYGQQEQFETSNRSWDDSQSNQQGEAGWRQDADRYYGGQGASRDSSDRYRNDRQDDRNRSNRSYDQGAGYASDFDAMGYRGQGRSYGAFTGNDFGGRDFSGNSSTWRDGRSGSGAYGAAPSSRYRDDERGFFEKAGDEVASWFGDDDAARRRQEDHRGRGPGNYTRSDQRILEDACDHITDDWRVDGTNIQVTVDNGEVTLDGTVTSRDQKRRAEDCVDHLSGVKHVQNNLRVNSETVVEKGSGPFI